MDKFTKDILKNKALACKETINKVIDAQYMLYKHRDDNFEEIEEKFEIPEQIKKELVGHLHDLASSSDSKTIIYDDKEEYYVYISFENNSIKMVGVYDDYIPQSICYDSIEEMLFMLWSISLVKQEQVKTLKK